MLNWIVWNRIVFDIETVLTLNWIVWNRTVLTFDIKDIYTKQNCFNRTVYMYKNGFGNSNLQWVMLYKTKPNQTKTKPKPTKTKSDEGNRNITFMQIISW